MIRVVLLSVLFASLPFLMYCVFATFRQPDKRLGEIVAGAPMVWLGGLGLVLMTAMLVVFGQGEGAPPGKTYHPPETRNGVIVPGHFD